MDPVVLIGLVLAAGFWIMTQVNVIWTKNALSKRVVKASAETKQQAIDSVMGMEKRLGAQIENANSLFKALETRLDAISIPEGDDIALTVENALNAKLEALESTLGPTVSEHVIMAFRQVEAQQSKRVGAFLKDMGIDEQLEGMEAAAREEALAAMGPQAQIAMEVLSTKIPKGASMIERTVMQFAKAQAAAMVQGQMVGVANAPAPAGSETRGHNGIGVR